MDSLAATRASSPRPGRAPALAIGRAGWLEVVRDAGVSARDLHILALAQHKLGGARELGEALRALAEATAELIPAGRIYLLGATRRGPIVGSLVSGVGLTAAAGGACVVRVARDGAQRVLGSFGA